MSHLEIPLLPHLQQTIPLHLVSLELDKLPLQRIEHAPWSATAEKPDVAFAIAHNRDCIFLKYYITERAVRARYRNTNDPVYKDSCVEFFIAFRGEQAYYNLEFNCLGTCRAGFGPDRHNRILLHTNTISQIRRFATLRAETSKSLFKTWHLTLAIPATVFSEHALSSFEEEQVSANFYKCGDELPAPHYLTWRMVQATEPDFHLPAYFAGIHFLPAQCEAVEITRGHPYFKASNL